jgi:hypothetical protein
MVNPPNRSQTFRYAIDCLAEADKILGYAAAGGAKSKPTMAQLNRVWELIRNAHTQLVAKLDRELAE